MRILSFQDRVNTFFSKYIIGIFIGILGSIILFRGILFEPEKYLWASDFDTRLITWILEWGYHVLVEINDFSKLWDANSFYPHTNSLAYSDSMIGAQPFYILFKSLGISNLSSLYLTLASFSILGAFLTNLALTRTNIFTVPEKATIIIVSHFGLGISSFFSHYQLFCFQMYPSFFIFLFLYIQNLYTFDLIFCLFVYILGTMFGTYLAPMVLVVSLIIFVLYSKKILISVCKKENYKRVVFVQTPLAVALFFLLYKVQLEPYLQLAGQMEPQPYQETAIYSAKISSLLKGFSINSFWYSPGQYSNNGDWERAIFPGYLHLVLTFLGIFSFIGISANKVLSRIHPSFAENKIKPEVLSFCLFSFILLIIFSLLSLGPFPTGHPEINLPFYYLADYIPGLRNVRAPGRFGAFTTLPIGIFIAFFMFKFRDESGIFKIIPILIVLAISIELLPQHNKYILPEENSKIVKIIRETVNINSPLIQLPVAAGDHISTLKNIMDQLNQSTQGYNKMVIGYGAKSTPECDELIGIDNNIRDNNRTNNKKGLEDLFYFAKKLEINNIIIDTNKYSDDVQNQISQYIHTDKFSILKEDSGLFSILVN